MTNAEMIAKLKDPKQAQPLGVYDEHDPELAKIIRDARPKNCLFINCHRVWVQAVTGISVQLSYIIKPDYQPEPEEPLATLVAKILIIRNHCDDALKVLQKN